MGLSFLVYSTVKLCIKFYENGFGYTLGDFFENSSGHPVHLKTADGGGTARTPRAPNILRQTFCTKHFAPNILRQTFCAKHCVPWRRGAVNIAFASGTADPGSNPARVNDF
jgi:hypothetical protein